MGRIFQADLTQRGLWFVCVQKRRVELGIYDKKLKNGKKRMKKTKPLI